MKISFFIGSMGSGGAERVISILANHYCAKGWDVEIALLLDTKVAYKLDDRIKTVDLTGKHSSYFKNLPGWLLGIRRYFRESKPDRVVSFVGRINALVLTATVGMKTPIIVSERNDPKRDGRGAFMLWLCKTSYRRAKRIVFQTEYQKSCFPQNLAGKSVVIPNPVAISAPRTEAIGERVVTAGRLTPQKQHAVLLEAAKRLALEHPDLLVEIYGDGALREDIQNQILRVGIQDTVKLCGNVTDLHKRIASAKVFVMTSEYEGLSNALVEAMMLGIPCVTTDYPGADEVVIHGENGFIVPCGDASAVAAAIHEILTEEGLRRKLAAGALQKSERYKLEAVMGLWEESIE